MIKLIQEGPRDAKIVIVGEAPGTQEMQKGRPFMCYAGDMLTNMLGRSGIARHECFITNLCHIQPPGNHFEHFYKSTGQADYIRGVIQLKCDLESIRPNLVIALGAHPLRALTGRKGINDWRGSILPCTLVKDLKVIGTIHPAAILRIWDYKCVAEFDLKRCAAEARFPELDLPKRCFYLPHAVAPQGDSHFTYGTLTPELLDEFCNAEWLAADIETIERPDGSWKVSCCGFSDRPDRAIVIALDGSESSLLIRRLLECPAKKIFQNGNIFYVPVLTQEGFSVRNYAWDTMLGHHSLYAESAGGEDEMSRLEGKKKQAVLRKGLAFQTSIYTREPRYKDDGKLWKEEGDLPVFWRYNGLDCCVTREIKDVQELELTAFGNTEVMEHEMALVEPLMAMTRKGIKVDLAVRDQLRIEIEEKIGRLEAFLTAGAGRGLNVSSSKQIQEFIYGDLKLPPKKKKRADGSMTPTADSDALIELSHKYHHPLLMTIIKIREYRKLKETYLDIPIDPDNYMRCTWDVTGTRSGRLASRTSLSGSGTNLQNQPLLVRKMYIPDDGKVILYRDYSQAEARVVAALANDAYLLELFADPLRDVHKETAAAIYGIKVENVTPEQRYTAKRVRHAVNYGMDAFRFVQVVNSDAEETGIRIDLATARRTIDGFFMLHPNHKTVYWKNIENELRATRTLTTAFGRKRTFYGRWDDKLLRDAYSYPPQSSVGDLCCKALVRVYHEIQLAQPAWGVELLANVHDSLLVQCWRSNVREVAEAMGDCMNIPMTVNGHIVNIPTDCKVGESNWKDLVDIDKWETEKE